MTVTKAIQYPYNCKIVFICLCTEKNETIFKIFLVLILEEWN